MHLVKRFEASMDAVSIPETSRKRFYEDNFELMMEIGN